MNINDFIKKRTKNYPNRCKKGYCARGKKQEHGKTFYGLGWDKVDMEIVREGVEFGASSFFGYVCADCYLSITGKDYRGMNIPNHLNRINKERKQNS